MHRATVTDLQHAEGLGDWRVLDVGASAWFQASSMTAGAALIRRIGELIADADLPHVDLPHLDLRPGGVRVRVGREGGLTRAGTELARSISTAAGDLGLTADPAALQEVALVIDTADQPTSMTFWRAVLGYEPVGAHGLGDPSRRSPAVTFHRSALRPLRDRIHVDVVRPPDAVEAVRAAVGQAPFGAHGVALADADGNVVEVVPGDVLSSGPETADWQVLFGAMAHYPVDSPAQAAALASAVAGLADDARLPLMVDLRPDGVTIDGGKDQWDDGEGSVTSGFAALAGQVQTAARDLGLAADRSRPRFVQLGMDAVDVPAVRAFWASVLGYDDDPRPLVTDIYDPRRLGPVLFFQQMDAMDTARRQHRNRVHLELYVAHDHVRARIDAAVAAGGRVVGDVAPGRRTLVDPEGNELDLVTTP
jgi:predicted enzyme related to lactoylglutathione lyase